MKAARKRFTKGAAHSAGLEAIRSHAECAAEWERISGQKLSRSMIYQILKSAEQKLRDGLESTAQEYFDE